METDFRKDLITTLNIGHLMEGHYPDWLELVREYSERSKSELFAMLIDIDESMKNRCGVSPLDFYDEVIHPVKVTERVKKKNNGLDPLFVVACNEICAGTDKRSTNAKLKAQGITPTQWASWLRTAKYKAFFDKCWNDTWKGAEGQAQLSLVRNIESGDLASIKHFHELTGVYRPNAEVTMNLGIIVAKLMEILSTKLSPEDLIEVADSMELIIQPPKELTA